MKIRDQMTRDIVTVTPQTPLDEARRLLETTHLRCLPVVTADRLIGLVLQSDPRVSAAPAQTPVQDLMAPATASTGPQARIERAARLILMLEYDVRGPPGVDEDGTLLGVLTATDLLRIMVKSPPREHLVLRQALVQ